MLIQTEATDTDDPANDPRTGTLVEDAPGPVALSDPDQRAFLNALAPGAARAEHSKAYAVLMREFAALVQQIENT